MLGQSVSVASGTYQFNDPHAGNKSVTIAGATLNNSDFTLGAVTAGTGVITPAPVTATVNGANKTYDATIADPGASATLAGVVTGDSLNLNATYQFNDKNAAAGKPVNALNPSLVAGNQSTNVNDYTLASIAPGAADINKLHITGNTLAPSSMTYNGTSLLPNGGSVSLTNTIQGDTIGDTGGTFTLSSKNVGTRTVIASGTQLIGTDASNYVLDSVATTTTQITPATISGTASVPGGQMTYNATSSPTNGTVALNVLNPNDQVSFTGAFTLANPNVGTTTVGVANGQLQGPDAQNYVLAGNSIASGNITINPAPLTASVSAPSSMIYSGGAAPSAGSVVLNGLLSGNQLSYTGAALALTNGGNVGSNLSITALGGQLSGNSTLLNNYYLAASVAPATGINVTPAPLTASVVAPGSMTYSGGAAPSSGSVLLSGLLGGNQLSYAGAALSLSNGGNVGSNLSISATGGQLSGNSTMLSNYYLSGAIAPATGISVNPATLTASIVAPSSMQYSGGAAPTAGSVVLSGLLGGNQLSYSGATLALSNGGNVGSNLSIGATGGQLSGSLANNYVLSGAIAPATGISVTPAPLTAAVSAPSSITYSGGAAPSVGSVVLNGLLGGNQLSYSGAALALSNGGNVGSNLSIGATGGQLSGNSTLLNNYYLAGLITPATGISVTPAPLTAAVSAPSTMTYSGGAVPGAGSVALTGLLGGNTLSYTGATFALSNGGNVGSNLSIGATGGQLSGNGTLLNNYYLSGSIAPATGINVTPAPLTASVLAPSSITYSGTAAPSTGSVVLSGLLGGNQLSYTGSLLALSNGGNVGSNLSITSTGGQLSGSGAMSSNYYLASPVAPATGISVTPAPLTASVVAPTNIIYSGGAAPSSGSVTLSGLLGGNQLSFAGASLALSNGGNVGSNLSITGAGGQLSGNGTLLNNYYLAGSIAPATGINVTPAPLTASVVAPAA